MSHQALLVFTEVLIPPLPQFVESECLSLQPCSAVHNPERNCNVNSPITSSMPSAKYPHLTV